MPLTVAQARSHIETDLADDALQRIIDAAEEDLGSETAVVEYFAGPGRRILFLSRPAATITSAIEHKPDADLLLVATDYRLFQGQMLHRLSTGTNPAEAWYEQATVTYVPDDLKRRTQAAIDLVRLAAERKSVSSEGVGDYRMTALDPEAERRRILAAFYRRSWA